FQLGEAARLLLRIAREWRKLGIGVRLLEDHDSAAVVGPRVLEAFTQPGEIGAVALGELRVAFGGGRETIVAAGGVQGQKGNAAEIPADILPILCELSVLGAALPDQVDAALAEALLAVEEQAAQLDQPLQRVAAGNALLGMAIRPFVVARRVDQRVRR